MSRNPVDFEKLLEKATNRLQPEPDLFSIIHICELISGRKVQPLVALAAIKKKTANVNPDIVLHALVVLEYCVKNCGILIWDVIATKEYMEQLKKLVKTTPHQSIKSKILELIQVWAHVFRDNSKYRAVQDTLNIMKTKGYEFPVLKDTSSESVDGEICHICKVVCDALLEEQQCMSCELTFCEYCSGMIGTLQMYPPLCISCYNEIESGSRDSSFAEQQQVSPQKTALQLQEEEDLIRALALSQIELKQKETNKKRSNSALKLSTSTIPGRTYSPPLSPVPGPSKLLKGKLDKPANCKIGDKTYGMSNTLIYSFTDQTEPPAEAITNSESTISALFELIKAVSDKVDKLERNQKAISRCKSCGQSQSRYSSNSLDENNLCFYHKNFGDKARKCMSSCPQYNTWKARLEN